MTRAEKRNQRNERDPHRDRFGRPTCPSCGGLARFKKGLRQRCYVCRKGHHE